MEKNKWLWLTLLVAWVFLLSGVGTAWASTQIPQTPLVSKALTKYLDPLPHFAGVRVDGTLGSYTVSYHEFQQPTVLPSNFVYPAPYTGTYVWGYQVGGAPAFYPGFTVEAKRGTATQVTYQNTLPGSPYLQKLITIDQTLHWANPLGLGMMDPGRFAPYSGPQPVVAHLHGAEVASAFDGGPDQWFTPNGLHGPGYKTLAGAAANEAIYRYVNTQEGTTLWFHEHPLGITRTNVYAGLAAFYFLRDTYNAGTNPTGAEPPNLPGNPGDNNVNEADRFGGIGTPVDFGFPLAYKPEVEIVIQDRMFDTNGQLLFPDIGINPEHPFWLPEFLGDTIVVNGKVWPHFNVEPRRYRLRLLNGSNARFYNLSFSAAGGTKMKGKVALPAFWVIGNDGGILDKPQMTPALLIAPGERYDVIVDFAAVAGQTLILSNDARAPFPGGAPVAPSTTAQIMQFIVGATTNLDNSFNPAAANATLRGGANQGPAMVRLAGVDAAGLPTGALAAGVTPARYRQLTLNEVMGPGGPLEVLVNNTKWSGLRPDGTPVPGSSQAGPNWLTELPQVGSTEVWEIINLTADAHPIHLHLVQFQILNRQPIRLGGNKGYLNAYNAAFPAGVFIPAYGPPQNYNTFPGTTDPITGKPIIGGNPDVNGFLGGPATPPAPYEMGWKDTAVMYPGQVTRIVVRWAPQNVAVAGVSGGTNLFPFDPTLVNATPGIVDANGAPGALGYVWHCHIIDHEDNEMMRPYVPTNNANNTTP